MTSPSPSIYGLRNLIVDADSTPIGGGKIGALTINHNEKKSFKEWDDETIDDLSHTINLMLKIYAQANIHNVLIFGKQDGENFKFSLVPYPKCNWQEKILGLFYAIFGRAALKEEQLQETRKFFAEQVNVAEKLPPLKQVEIKKETKINDPFCQDSAAIDRQKFGEDENGIHVLYDHRPKGRTKEDPHFLIVPPKEQGHLIEQVEVQESKLIDQRTDMLFTMHKCANLLAQENFKTILFLERNGPQLQGLTHKTGHVIGVKDFPTTWPAKILTFFRLLCPSLLSAEALKAKVESYKTKWTNLTEKV